MKQRCWDCVTITYRRCSDTSHVRLVLWHSWSVTSEHPPRSRCWQPGNRCCSSSAAAAGHSSSHYRSCCPRRWRVVVSGCRRQGTERWSSTGSSGAWRSGSEWEQGNSAGFPRCLVLGVDAPPPPPPGRRCEHRTQGEWISRPTETRCKSQSTSSLQIWLYIDIYFVY